ncbi:MAG: ABC transporter ATP-binding protein [Jatrophihabitans sp.]
MPRADSDFGPVTGSAPLRLTDVTKSLAGKPVLTGVTFRCPPGAVTVLLGPNGAGKTTTVTIAAGLRRPRAGSAQCFGVPCSDPAARRLLSVVPQEIAYPGSVRVRELLRFVSSQRPSDGLGPPEAELLDRLGLHGLAHRQIGGLSGGQRRRLAVALGLVRAPQLLVMDEATSSLDHETRLQVWQLIGEYAGRGGAVLATTHILGDADLFADRVLVMAGGEVVRDGTAAQIRGLVGGQRIRIRPSAERRSTVLSALRCAGIETTTDGEAVQVLTEHAEDAVRTILMLDPDATGLEVSTPSLAEALELVVTELHPPATVGAEGSG